MNDTYWTVTVYEGGDERETIRGLNLTTKDTLLKIFDREGIHATAMEYDADGSSMLNSETVNSPH